MLTGASQELVLSPLLFITLFMPGPFILQMIQI